jgi:hypothetical protein
MKSGNKNNEKAGRRVRKCAPRGKKTIKRIEVGTKRKGKRRKRGEWKRKNRKSEKQKKDFADWQILFRKSF